MRKVKNLNVYTIIIMAIVVVFVIIGSVFLSGIITDPQPIVDNFYKVDLAGAIQGGYMQNYDNFKVGAELELPIVKVESGNALVSNMYDYNNHVANYREMNMFNQYHQYYRVNKELKDVAKITIVYDKYLYNNSKPVAEVAFANVKINLNENNFYNILYDSKVYRSTKNFAIFDDGYYYNMDLSVQYAVIYEVPEDIRFYQVYSDNRMRDYTDFEIKCIN